jgi:hypothetical protein
MYFTSVKFMVLFWAYFVFQRTIVKHYSHSCHSSIECLLLLHTQPVMFMLSSSVSVLWRTKSKDKHKQENQRVIELWVSTFKILWILEGRAGTGVWTQGFSYFATWVMLPALHTLAILGIRSCFIAQAGLEPQSSHCLPPRKLETTRWGTASSYCLRWGSH